MLTLRNNQEMIDCQFMQIIKNKNSTILLPQNSELLAKNSDEISKLNHYFDINFWKKSEQVVGHSVGRNITYFVKGDISKKTWVLRHYYRGGLIAKIIKDRYLYRSLENTRVFKEIALLEKMIEMKLPVPAPIGGSVIVSGLFYRAD